MKKTQGWAQIACQGQVVFEPRLSSPGRAIILERADRHSAAKHFVEKGGRHVLWLPPFLQHPHKDGCDMRAALSYYDFIKQRLARDGFIEIVSSGTSMFPLIRSGNRCRFVPFDAGKVKIGDLLLFVTEEQQLVGHRLIRIRQRPEGTEYVCKGDANLKADKPVTAELVIGRMVHIQKGDRQLRTDSLILKTWGRIMVRFPSLSVLLRRCARRYGR